MHSSEPMKAAMHAERYQGRELTPGFTRRIGWLCGVGRELALALGVLGLARLGRADLELAGW